MATSNEARILVHEGLQKQPSTGTQQGGVSTPVAATMRPTANSPPVERERRTTAPAGMNRERGRETHALGGLQQQEWTGDRQQGVQQPDSYDALSGNSGAGGTRTTHGYPGMDEYEDGGHSPRASGATTTTVDRGAAGRE